jgi:hypothetical protein
MLSRRLIRLLTALPVAAALAAPGLMPSTARAALVAAPPPAANWPVTVSGSHPNTGIDQPYSSPAVGDLFGDGNKEVVAGFLDGTVRAYSALTGQQLWARQTGGEVDASPTLASLSADGRLEVVVTSRSGYINVFNPDGSNFPGWPVFPSAIGGWTSTNFPPAFFASAAVGDLFNDGNLEVVTAGWDHRLYAFNANGGILPGFPINLWDTVWDTPLLLDLEGTGRRDIVIGSDSNGGITEPYPKGGVWWAFRPNGTQVPGWPRWQDEVPWSSPAAAALNPGEGPSIVTGTGHYVAQTTRQPVGTYVSVWNTQGGLRSRPGTGGQNFGSPALGDLLGDGRREIVETSEDGKVYAWFADGTPVSVKWPIAPTNGTQIGSAIIAPVDSSCPGINGVWVPGWYHLLGYCADGTLKLDIPTGQILSPGAIPTAAPATAAPTVADLGDGHLSLVEVYQADGSNTSWRIGVWPLNVTALNAGSWPTFHGSMLRNGTPPVAPDPHNAVFVKNLYYDVLGRHAAAPAAAEVAFWAHRLDNGARRYWVASAFVISEEAHGSIVDGDYLLMLNRLSDSAGRAFWVQQLGLGVPNEKIIGLLGGSTEYYFSPVRGKGDNLDLVVSLYTQILRRTPPSSDSGVQYWLGWLKTHPAAELATMFANSHEYHLYLVNGPRGWYQTYLRRTGEANGAEFWATYLDQGRTDDAGIVSLISSPEYFVRPSVF